jgi:hypothetical protein
VLHHRRSLPGRAAAGLVVVAALGLASASAAAAYHEPEALFTLRDPEITESSGVAASARSDDLFFTHNDSGDTARFFAVDANGCTQAVFDFADRGIVAEDWEDMARGPEVDGTPTLWIADTGDNAARRESVTVHRVFEPRVKLRTSSPDPALPCPPARARTVAATAYELRYEDGPHDSEALLVDPTTGQLFVVTKVGTGDAALYAAPERLRKKHPNVLRAVAAVRGITNVTSGDIAPDGTRLVLRTYDSAYEFEIPDGDPTAAFASEPRTFTLPSMPQGEAITYTRDADAWVTTSEGAGTVVYRLADHP